MQASEDALDLLARLAAFDPARRPSASEALAHRFFRAGPAPTPPERLPQPPVRARNPLTLPAQACPLFGFFFCMCPRNYEVPGFAW